MINLSQVNSKLKSREKRTHQNVAPIPTEVKELSKKKARLEAKVSQLERDVRKQFGSRPAVAKASLAQQTPAKTIPAKKAQASRKTTAETEVTTLVVPRKRKDFGSDKG